VAVTRAVRIRRFGGTEVLQIEDIAVGAPGPGEVRIAHEAIGLNMIDCYCRSGLYPLELPSGLGCEAAGRITAVGPGVSQFATGARVAYAAPAPFAAGAAERLIDARGVVELPAPIAAETAAAIMLKGMTSWVLLHRSYRVAAGDWIVVHAAAGGVGSLLVPWAARLGARVIGIVGSAAKRAPVAAAGASAVLLTSDDWVGAVRGLTGGNGVAAVYDSVGRATFSASLDCLARHGVMVSFGNASGPVDPVAPLELMRRGSLYLTRPTIFDFICERAVLETATAALFELVTAGALPVAVNQRFALDAVAAAHRALESRQTTGATVLLP
jgi:NADPH2:quinone reductase